MEQTNKYKRSLLLVITGLVLLFALAFVSAVPTLVTPATSGSVTGSTQAFNVTNSSMTETINCTIYAFSVSTANSSAVSLGLLTNNTAHDFDISGALSTKVIEDSNNYQFYAICANATAIQTSATNTGITVNNTVPSAPTAPSATVTGQSVSFTSTVVGANTTGCTLTFSGVNYGGSNQAMTHSGNTCTLSLTNVPEQSYTWYITASDGSESSAHSSSTTTRVDVKTSATKFMTPSQVAKAENERTLSVAGNSNQKTTALWIVAIVVVMGMLWYFNRK